MMKNLLLVFVVLTAVLFVGCTKEDQLISQDQQPGIAEEAGKDDITETEDPGSGETAESGETAGSAESKETAVPLLVKPDDELPEGTPLIERFDVRQFALHGANTSIGEKKIVPVEGQPFKEAVQAITKAQASQLWDAQLSVPIKAKVEKGDTIVVRFYIRSLSEGGVRAETVYIFERAGDPYTKSVDNGIQFGKEWEKFQFAFTSQESYESGKANLIFRMGFAPQAYELGGVELVNYGKSLTVERFEPVLPTITYAGREDDAAWRKEAEKRIEEIRKSDIQIKIVDSAGKAVEGAEVHLQMKKHAFQFGSAVSANFIQTKSGSEDYNKYVENFEKLFNTATIENALKWPAYEGEWGPSYKSGADKTLKWLQEKGIEVRGHTLVWPGYANLPKDIPSLAQDKDALRKRINEHIVQEVNEYKGRISEWDVINEPNANHDLMDVLGQDEMFEWIKLARSQDPKVPLYINEYSMERSETWTKNMEHILTRAKELGAKVDGLGIQSHFLNSADIVVPEKLYAFIDRFAPLVDEIKVTEFDMKLGADDLEADYIRDVMTVFFSHPKVNGFVLWGFWDGAHWHKSAPIFRQDWSLKPSGQTYMDLVFKKWWTDEKGATDKKGNYSTRAFMGDYEVTVTHNGLTRIVSATLDAKGKTLKVVLK